jgi:hypothetical protein
MSRLVLSVAKPDITGVAQTRVEVPDAGSIRLWGEHPTLLGFSVLSPTCGHNRSQDGSMRLLAVRRGHRLSPVEYSPCRRRTGAICLPPCGLFRGCGIAVRLLSIKEDCYH